MTDIAAVFMQEEEGALMRLMCRAMPPLSERMAFVGVIGAMTARGIAAADICQYIRSFHPSEIAFEGCEQGLLAALVDAMIERNIDYPDICKLVKWICRGTNTVMVYMRKVGVHLE